MNLYKFVTCATHFSHKLMTILRRYATLNVLMTFDVCYSVFEVSESFGGNWSAQFANEHLCRFNDTRMPCNGVDSSKDQRVCLHVVSTRRAERRLPH